MRTSRCHRIAAAALMTVGTVAAEAQVTLDFNGYPNIGGGRVHGPGLDEPIVLPEKQRQVVLENLRPSETYTIDFFNSSGEGSSDFTFVMNEVGTGVAAVTPGGGVHTMVKGFKRDAAVLVLNTHPIVLNANSGQTMGFFMSGLIGAHTLPADPGPIEVAAIPGIYNIDNLHNAGGGNEDFAFRVSDRGIVSAAPGAEEYAEFERNAVKPRSAIVRFVIEASEGVNYHATFPVLHAEHEAGTFNYTFDMRMGVGGGGLNVWSFGKNTIKASDAIKPDGTPLAGKSSDNDMHFAPRLRFDADKGFFFETTGGPSSTSHAAATGFFDGDEKPLKVKVTATVLSPLPKLDGR